MCYWCVLQDIRALTKGHDISLHAHEEETYTIAEETVISGPMKTLMKNILIWNCLPGRILPRNNIYSATVAVIITGSMINAEGQHNFNQVKF